MGDGGYIACIVALGENASKVVPSAHNGLVSVTSLDIRAGQAGVLFWNTEGALTQHIEQLDFDRVATFPYDTTVSKHLANMAYVGAAKVQEHVDLLAYISSATERLTTVRSEKYMELTGEDSMGCSIGVIRLCRFDNTAIANGGTYIIRGLKVVKEQVWSQDDWKYVTKSDGINCLDCSYRTAVEDVSDVDAICALIR